MKMETENRFFKLTKAGIDDYKRSDPLKTARDPRQRFAQWDINWGIGKWIITIIFLIGSFAIDLILISAVNSGHQIIHAAN